MVITGGSLFSGIGGFELGLTRGLARSGVDIRFEWQVEIDEWCRRVLAKHWPEATRHEDVREVSNGVVPAVDLLCGGFPCQDLSLAGKGAGLDGARSGLWFEYLRIVEELAPRLICIENVLGLRTRGLRTVLAGLADLGFDAEWACIQVGSADRDTDAIHLDGPHRRQRLFIVAAHPERVELRDEPGWFGRACWEGAAVARAARAHGAFADAESERGLAPVRDDDGLDATADRRGAGHALAPLDRGAFTDADGEGEPQQTGPIGSEWRRALDGSWRPPVGAVRRVDDGIPHRSHGRRLKALGNAIAVPCAELVGQVIGEHLHF